MNRELFYPEVGLVLGRFAKSRALFYVCLESDTLVKEALHEAGHLMGLEHCMHFCVMSL